MNDEISTELLFVYGTLMKGLGEDWQSKVRARLIGHGRITGKLYDLGDYPGAVASSDKRDRVEGELYELYDPDLARQVLDEYEEFFPSRPHKSLFVRRVVPVRLENGRQEKAWVYLYNRGVDGARLIPRGNYRERVSARK